MTFIYLLDLFLLLNNVFDIPLIYNHVIMCKHHGLLNIYLTKSVSGTVLVGHLRKISIMYVKKIYPLARFFALFIWLTFTYVTTFIAQLAFLNNVLLNLHISLNISSWELLSFKCTKFNIKFHYFRFLRHIICRVTFEVCRLIYVFNCVGLKFCCMLQKCFLP